jgi:hypothetical protein
MADFFARVELHGARWPDDYTALHDALSKHGFTNRIVGTAGVSRLPTGFYYSADRIDDVQKVAAAVKACADSTGFPNEVIVIKNAGWNAYLSKS